MSLTPASLRAHSQKRANWNLVRNGQPGQLTYQDAAPTPQQNRAAYTDLIQLLRNTYTDQTAEAAFQFMFLKSFDEARTGALDNEPIKGSFVSGILERANELSTEYLNHNVNTNARIAEVVPKLAESDVKWPDNLVDGDKDAVKNQVVDIMQHQRRVDGEINLDMVHPLTQYLANQAGELKAQGQGARLPTELAAVATNLKAAIDADATNQALNNQGRLGNLMRTLQPPLSTGGTDHGVVERRFRMGKVKDLIDGMAGVSLQTELGRNVSLRDVFSRDTGIWQGLNRTQRTAVIQRFLDLHAQTFGYPEKPKLETDQPANRISHHADDPRSQDLRLTRETLETNDPRQLLRVLSHELTHVYQNWALSNDTPYNQTQFPPEVRDRLKFDNTFRKEVLAQGTKGDFVKVQNDYANHASERGAMEAEVAALRWFDDGTISVAQMATDTRRIETQAGTERLGLWQNSMTYLEQRADATGVSAADKAKNLVEAAGVGAQVGMLAGNNRAVLDNTLRLLDKIDLNTLTPAQKAETLRGISKVMTTLIPNTSGNDKKIAQDRFVKAQMDLMNTVTQRPQRRLAARNAFKMMSAMIKADPALKRDQSFMRDRKTAFNVWKNG